MAIEWTLLIFWWAAWFYPLIFRAPHIQRRPSITIAGPTRAGLLLETVAIFLAFTFRSSVPPDAGRIAASMLMGAIAAVLSWTSVAHLGRQFRIHAGLYEDHELVRTGPYAVIRHPIYAGLLAMLLCTILLITRWACALVALLLFVIGTEIRIHSEEKLLASRFGAQFDAYRNRVCAYIPFIR